MSEKKYYSKTELAKAVGLDRHTLRRWEQKGLLVPSIDNDGKKYYLLSQIHTIQQNKTSKKNIVTTKNTWVNLSNIPLDTAGRYSWIDAAKNHVIVEYGIDEKQGIITILDFNRETRTLQVVIDESTEQVQISSPAFSKGMINKLTGYYTHNYKYTVGDIIKEGKTDITITGTTRSSNSHCKAYECICNICNQPNIVTEYNIKESGCCPVCSGNKVVKGINDIATTAPWMIDFFPDPTIAETNTFGSSKKFYPVCPDCGKQKKHTISIHTLHSTKSIGCVCGDGYSYPNKFMFSVCEQLQELNEIAYFDKEYSPPWLGNKKFDFYINKANPCNQEIIIEIDGGLGHGKKSKDKHISVEETKKIDLWKDLQAQNHGIPVIRINAEESTLDYLKANIVSLLSSHFNFEKIDWEKADRFAISNLTKKVCEYYKSHNDITIKELAKQFHISDSTARKYVFLGEKYGWCKYNWELCRKNRINKKQSAARKERVIEVCQYYQENAPILSTEIAKHFGISGSAVLSYLKAGEKLGFKPYDKEYSRQRNIEQIKSLKRKNLGKTVLCFSTEKELLRKYPTATEAANDFNCSLTSVSRCCIKKGTCSGYLLRYEDDCEIAY